MISWLLLLAALAGPPGAGEPAAQVLELPAVTLVGADTLYLQPPSPPSLGALPRVELASRRRGLAEPIAPQLPGAPALAARLGRTTAAGASSGGSDARGGTAASAGPLAEAGAGRPGLWQQLPVSPGGASARGWSLLAYYLPGRLVRSGVQTVNRVGSWETAGQFDLGLADGWLSLSPGVPSFLFGRFEAAVEAPAVLRLSGSAGAFRPPGTEQRYCLGITEELILRLGRVRLLHGTEAAGLSPSGDAQRVGLLGQRLAVESPLGDFSVHAGATAYLRGALEPAAGDVEGLARLTAGYREPQGRLGLSIGAAGLYREGSFGVYPEGILDFAPWAAFRVRLQGAAFLSGAGVAEGPPPAGTTLPGLVPCAGSPLVPLVPLGLLDHGGAGQGLGVHPIGTHAVEASSSVPALRPESGYCLRGSALLAPGDRVRAELAAELLYGSVYEGWGGSFAFREVSRIAALAQLSAWLLRFGGAGAGLEVTARGFAALSLPAAGSTPAQLLDELYGQRLEADLRLAFPNLPLRFIMGCLWGEVPAGPPAAVLASPWEPFRGLAVSLSADLELSRRHAIRAGGEVRFPEGAAAPQLRFLAGYRRQGP
ncbi:MAG: hypothetical protein JW820_01225 [Spirochaetales bacterium]|nr:hypothetical protein [Spirochaetales bacterium]